MQEEDFTDQLQATLLDTSGGFLRNPLRPAAVTCDTCSGPVDPAYDRCHKCAFLYGDDSRCADQVASMTYAVKGRQSGFMMHMYKATPPVAEHQNRVAFLAWVGISHRDCAGIQLGREIEAWATVPSLPAKPGEHQLHRIVSRYPYLGDLEEVTLSPAASPADPRGFEPTNFTASPDADGRHVLLIDDTWASGGHTQSAAAALKAVGAAAVSALSVARWLSPGWGPTDSFLKDHFDRREYDPSLCPWTGFRCP